MKAISTIYALTIAAAAVLPIGCVAGGNSAASGSGASGATKSKKPENATADAAATMKRKSEGRTPVATHCRIGHRYTEIAGPLALVWDIRKAEAADFISDPDMNFEVVKNNFNQGVSSPFKIDNLDTFTGKETSKGIEITYTNLSGQPDKNFSAVLQLDSSMLWAKGPATLQDGTDAGTIVMLALPDANICEHSYYKSHPPRPSCRAVVIEHFDKNDTNAKGDIPEIGRNVFPIGDQNCKTGELLETSDGEGHQGPK